MTSKPQVGDKFTISVSFGNRYNNQESVEAEITYVAESGRVFFKPLKKLLFVDYTHRPEGNVSVLHKGIVYSTDDFASGELSGCYKSMLFITKHEVTPKIRTIDVTIEAPTLRLEDIPKHDNAYTSKLDANGFTSSVVNTAGEFFKAFASGPHHHHFMNPQSKLNTTLTIVCEDAKKKAEEFREATLITDRVVNHGDIEYTVRMMLKAGLTPHQIAEEIQRQFYNAMVKE